MSRRGYAESDVSVDRYEDRREYDRRPSRVSDDRYYEEEKITRQRSRDPPRRREEDIVEREEVIRVRSRSKSRSPPPFLREDYGRSSAGPMVLRAREREEIEFTPRSRRRDPSPESDRIKEREEIIIRRDEDDSRDRLPPLAPLAPPPRERDREEIIIRRDERDDRYRDGLRPREFERERDREEIVIRRDEDREGRYDRRRDYDDYALARPKSHERERDEIIIRRDERDGRHGERDREEIIIRHNSRSPSPDLPPAPLLRPPIVQEVITHHRHIDHGYEPVGPRPPSRLPSPKQEERIEIVRKGERNGRPYEEDIIIDRNESGPINAGALAPYRPPPEDPYPPPGYYPPPGRRPRPGYDDPRDYPEAAYYNDRAMSRAYPGEAYRGATRDWSLVDVPPGTDRIRMDGAGGGEQEITWQRYNGVRRSQFHPNGDPGYPGGGMEIGRPMPGAGGTGLGPRYGNPPDPRDRLWTEITKDLVVKEAIVEMGYEFEETEDFYYVFKFLRYDDVQQLVRLSDDIKGRHRRVKQLDREQKVDPPPVIDDRRYIEAPPSRRDGGYEYEEDRYIERDVVYRGPPPPGPRWR